MTTLRLPRLPRIGAAVIGFLLALTLALAKPVKFDIPAQPAPAAVQAFIKQSGLQVVYDADALRTVSANAVHGEFEPLSALQQLLAGTGFTAREQGPSHFVIESTTQKPGSVEGSVQSESGRPVAGASVSLVGSNQTVLTDKRGRFTFDAVPAGSQSLAITADGMQNTKVTDVNVKSGHRLTLSSIAIPVAIAGAVQLEEYVVSAKKNDGVVELDPYEVRSKKPQVFTNNSIDLVRTKTDILPYTTFTSKEIGASGAQNLEEFFRARLSQNLQDVISDEQGGNGLDASAATANSVNLRGWGGASESVVLINGRRLPMRYAPTGVDPRFGDFRGIPLGSIERIEVLSAAGSAIYGEGATAGVINIITRTNYQGGHVNLGWQNPGTGSAPKTSLQFGFTTPQRFGTSVTVSASFERSEPLSVADRASVYAPRWRNLQFPLRPTLTSRVIAPPIGATTNISTASTASSSRLFPTGDAYYTSVPDGYRGVGGLLPFLNRQGIYNLDMSEGSVSSLYSKNATIGPVISNRFLELSLNRTLRAGWNTTLSYQYRHSERDGTGDYFTGSGSASFIVPSAAKSNPFGQDVRVQFDDPRLQRPDAQGGSSFSTINDVIFTVRGEVENWKVLVDANISQTKTGSELQQFYAPLGGWRNAFLTGTYDPFLDMRVADPALPAFYERYVRYTQTGEGRTNDYLLTVKGAGEILLLPTGPVTATLGVEALRNERRSGSITNSYVDSQTGESAPNIAGDPPRSIDNAFPSSRHEFATLAVFSEMDMPILVERNKWPLLRRMSLFAAGRYSSQKRKGYTASGIASIYKSNPYVFSYGVKYEPVPWASLRVSRSAGFKPPSVAQVSPPNISTNSITLTDPLRSNQVVTLAPQQYITGGNPNIRPETTVTNGVGLIVTARGLGNARFLIDYNESKRDNAITSITPQEVLFMEGEFPSRVTRSTNANGQGELIFLDASNINLRKITARSVDVSIEIEFEEILGGRVFAATAVTRQIAFVVQTTNAGDAVEQVRNPGAASVSRQLKWNGSAQLRWERGPFAIGWAGRYFDRILVRPTIVQFQGAAEVPDAIEHDIHVSCRWRESHSGGLARILGNTSLTAGVKNIFDRQPRFWAESAPGVAPFDSVAGRSFWVQLHKEF